MIELAYRTASGRQGLTVGTYSLGNLFVVYEINKHVWENVRTTKRQ